MKRTLLFLVILLAMVASITSKAHATCSGFITRTEACVGGCIVETDSCFFGCIAGTCVNQGGSGLCCKTIYYSAEIYGDGGFFDECSWCSEARRTRPKMSMNPSHKPVQFWGGGTADMAQMGELGSVRPEKQVLAANRCSHTYNDSSIAAR